MTIKGLPWPRGTVVYHATTALSSVMEQGLKTRAEIGRHATGMGPESAISFTLDPRVAYAICIGLRALAKGVQGKLLLGDAVIQARKLAPRGLDTTLKQTPWLKPLEVERRDKGWVPFRWSKIGSNYVEFGLDVETETQLDDLVAHAETEDVTATYATNEGPLPLPIDEPGPTKPIWVSGWVRLKDVKAAAARWVADPHHYLRERRQDMRETRAQEQAQRVDELRLRPWFAEFYKRWLHFGHFGHTEWTGKPEGEVYNPLFMGTDLEPLYQQNTHDIGIVAAEIDAENLCIEWRDAEVFGYTPEQMKEYLHAPPTASSWHSDCERYLQAVAEGRPDPKWLGPRHTEPPDPSDTVLYKSAAMSELRVYDTSVIRNLRVFSTMRQVLDGTTEEWADPTVTDSMTGAVDLDRPPIAFPFFRGSPMSVDWTEPNPKIVSLDPLMAAAANPEEE